MLNSPSFLVQCPKSGTKTLSLVWDIKAWAVLSWVRILPSNLHHCGRDAVNFEFSNSAGRVFMTSSEVEEETESFRVNSHNYSMVWGHPYKFCSLNCLFLTACLIACHLAGSYMSFSRSLLSRTTYSTLITESHKYSKGLSTSLKGTVFTELDVGINVMISVTLHHIGLYRESTGLTFLSRRHIYSEVSHTKVQSLCFDDYLDMIILMPVDAANNSAE